MKPITPKILRCAIYTRVSTDHRLEQEFNSLDNQHEAAQAYVKSQAHEGWRPVRERYQDAGFSGGSLTRPALQKLLTDIRDRRIDVVVVYKVDRLTRSLADFAKLVELFDQNDVSFVSVTQNFNTTTSMGRLTLNVLLSFAQFEREVTGERIRDKIAASKRKGIWMGGVVPLGYALHDRRLVVDEAEAKIVRLVFERYLASGSLAALQRELRELGVCTRRRNLKSGIVRGGVALTNGPLRHMLRNRTYLGEINHLGKSYPGEHAAIIDPTIFAEVQNRLDGNRRTRKGGRMPTQAWLTGCIYDDRGNHMSPSYATRKGLRYRYYVSTMLLQGRRDAAGSVPRVPAQQVEDVVAGALAPILPDRDPELIQSREHIGALIDRVIVRAGSIEIHVAQTGDPDVAADPIAVPWSIKPLRRRREVIRPVDDTAGIIPRPIRAEARSKLLYGIARARAWLSEIMLGTVADADAIAGREAISARTVRMTLSLAFIAPDIIEAAVDGLLPRGFGLSRLVDLPPNWAEQRRVLGLPVRP